MAALATSSSYVPKHKVFINFRGKEVRNNFLSHLKKALKGAEINAFIDVDDGVGKDISDLFVRIEESRIAVVIFSSDYCGSKWCMNELVRIMDCAQEGKLTVIPIFYKVEPGDVKRLKESSLRSMFGWVWEFLSVTDLVDDVTRWNQALAFVTKKRGLKYSTNCNESEFIEEITEALKKKLREIPEEVRGHTKENPEMHLMMTEQIHSACTFTSRNDLDHVLKDKITSYALRANPGFESEALLRTSYPGCEVPSWFDQQAVGSAIRPKLPPQWHEGLYGIALCAVASFWDEQYQNSRILVQCTSKLEREDGPAIQLIWNVGDWTSPGKIEQEQVFIGYTNRCHITNRLKGRGLTESVTAEPILEFKVTDGTDEVKLCKITKCGFSLIYAESNCLMIYAGDLSITWSNQEEYWTWCCLPNTTNGTQVEVAKLVEVCWLDISGKFDTKDLTHGTRYEVVFVVGLEDLAYGWDPPVNVTLALPTGQYFERKVSLEEQMRNRWLYISAGEFEASPEMAGEMRFSMHEHNSTGTWKKGLLVKGVAIRPISHRGRMKL
ncbi:PREDICTED: uncharacterized protein LOC104811622 [Tarenaya hassleriana]|uniref:uncharacterized protein LOC104811622 n=1 Tax=Tarenaya hassleriana TaxID=28532 RepID=UPI00053C2ED3|nr:PREDICTED: uncharacterized protein LOC104811622 [Tarenaya hassleriana]